MVIKRILISRNKSKVVLSCKVLHSVWFITTTIPEQSPVLILLFSVLDMDDTNKSRSLRNFLSGCEDRYINLISSVLRCYCRDRFKVDWWNSERVNKCAWEEVLKLESCHESLIMSPPGFWWKDQHKQKKAMLDAFKA